MEKYWTLIKQNYVINRVVSVDQPSSEYLVIEDTNCNASIGDWYEESEGIFYKPLSTPSDLPDDLL